MTKWEYRTCRAMSSDMKDALEQYGNSGWELVSVLYDAMSGWVGLIFKRPKETE